MDERISRKEVFFASPTNEQTVLNEDIATFSTNLRVPIDVTVEIEPKTEGWTDVYIYSANCEFQFPSLITSRQPGAGEPSPTNRRPVLPGLSVVRSDGSILDIYKGSLTVHDDGSWTVTRSSGNYHPTGNEPSYSKTGSQILFQLPDIYKVSSYNYHPCSDFANTVAYNSYAYIRTDMSIAELQAYFASHTVDLILPLNRTETYEITFDEVKQTMARMSRERIASDVSVSIGTAENPVYGGELLVNRDGSADLTVTHDLIDGNLQELDTPVSRHLESAEMLWSYFGTNSVWANSGKIKSVRYRTQTALDGMLWERDRALQIRRRAILTAAYQAIN